VLMILYVLCGLLYDIFYDVDIFIVLNHFGITKEMLEIKEQKPSGTPPII